MDVEERIRLIAAPPTQEIVTEDDLRTILETNDAPRHYIGLEISGFLHLGSLLSVGYKINDFARAGVRCTVFLADWHTVINDKLGGSWDAVSRVTRYYRDAFRLVCPDAEIRLGTDLYNEKPGYWQELVAFTKHMSLERTKRALTIMGRSEDEKNMGLARLLYPPMQAVDIHSLDVDIAHAGMDQRRIHMLVREIFPKMGWKVPAAVHHGLLPGLSRPAGGGGSSSVAAPDGPQAGAKMSKSDPDSSVFMHDTDEQIQKKIKKAWCEEGDIENNPVLAIAKSIVFHDADRAVTIERPEKFGGNVSYDSYESLESAFGSRSLHPADLKRAIGSELARIVAPIRDRLTLSDETTEAIKNSSQ
ncbi:MAG: tyrosine--tRNA ligase [Nitrosopumilaceae archaeon]|nr:tyrosine--tRNA ligase [Nitrosopumilaceae archaeon]